MHKNVFYIIAMSATLRAIDLVTLTVAPVLTGQIMTYASTRIGALFIGGWNLVSVFIEYYLLWKVYDIVPALRKQRFKRKIDKGITYNQLMLFTTHVAIRIRPDHLVILTSSARATIAHLRVIKHSHWTKCFFFFFFFFFFLRSDQN